MSNLEEEFLSRARALLQTPQVKEYATSPLSCFTSVGNVDDQKRGRELISKGKVAALVVAGGQGSRLRFRSPKGCAPVSVIQSKTLFQLFAERVLAASHAACRSLQIAFMTSPQNHLETLDYFQRHAFFGLNAEQVHFFSQEEWPLLDFEGNVIHNGTGANGNGGALRYLASSPLFPLWKKMGIEMVEFHLVDNALSFPFDPELIGFHARFGNEVSVKAAKRRSAKEHVGVLVEAEGRVEVIEYSECPSACSDLQLYPLANLSLFCFQMEFIEKVAHQELPLHKMRKAVAYLDEAGKRHFPDTPNAWKFEEFIFDVLPYSCKTGVLVYPREQIFAPLKNYEGENTLDDVKRALQEVDRRAWLSLAKTPPPPHPFELAAPFHYPTPEMLKKLEGALPPSTPYISVDF